MSGSKTEPVVITGCGWVTPFASGSVHDILRAAPRESAEEHAAAGHWAVPTDQFADADVLSKELRSDRGASMAGVALTHARSEAAVTAESFPPERVGLSLGCALAGQLGMIDFANEVREQTARFVSPIHFPQTVGNFVAGALARGFDIRGPNLTLSGGIACGLDAIVEACRLLHSGSADVVYAGGFDSLSPALAQGLAETAHRGRRLAEGACLFVLERADNARGRGAAPRATIVGSSHGAGPPRGAGIAPPDLEAFDGIVSVAGPAHPGAVHIESWIGRCFAALGAAAVAAAIGAADDLEVPLSGPKPDAPATVGKIAAPDRSNAVIIADTDGTRTTELELSILPQSASGP